MHQALTPYPHIEPMAPQQLLVLGAGLASLLALMHWIQERPSGRMLESPVLTGGGAVASIAPAAAEEDVPEHVSARAGARAGKAAADMVAGSSGHDRCTIVYIHNRKGCVFDGRAHLPESGADAAIPNPAAASTSPPAARARARAGAGAGAAHGAEVGSGAGWAAAALNGGAPEQQQRLKRPPKGQPFGPPQTTMWKVGG